MKERQLDVQPAERANVRETDSMENIHYRLDDSRSTD